MAGRPIRRLMIAELERRATEAGPTEAGESLTPIDVVCEWTAEGKTLAELARDLTDTTGQTISSGILSSWINSTKDGKAKIEAARALAAHGLAEQSLQVLDDLDGTEVTREEVQLAKARSEVRQWLASKWNRPQYGADTAQVNVAVSLPSLHLQALQRRAQQLKAQTTPQLAPVEADYEVVE